MSQFDDRIVVVTGAAGFLGRAVVSAYHAEGAIVCALDHQPGRLQRLFPGINTGIHFFDAVDVTDDEAMLALAEKIEGEVGSPDILVNVLGGFFAGEKVYELTAENWNRMLALNVGSFLNLTKAFVPGLLQKGYGKVLSVASRAGLTGSAGMGAYAAAKSALIRLSESLAVELAEHNIQVNCVLPGTIDTAKNRAGMPNADFTKWVSTQVIAETILFLTSSKADGITGAAIPVFGRP